MRSRPEPKNDKTTWENDGSLGKNGRRDSKHEENNWENGEK